MNIKKEGKGTAVQRRSRWAREGRQQQVLITARSQQLKGYGVVEPRGGEKEEEQE